MNIFNGLNLSELSTETIITWITLGLILLLMILIFIQIRKVMITLLNKSIFIKDEIYIEHDTQLRLEFSNKSYVNTALLEIGFNYQKEFFAIIEEEIVVQARSFEKIDYSLEALREKLLNTSRKVKPIFIYTKNSVGEVIVHKAKRITKHLKKVIKLENKALKQERKKIRYQTGNYNFIERMGLVLKWIFSPLVKLNRFFKKKINSGLKKREERLRNRKELKALEETPNLKGSDIPSNDDMPLDLEEDVLFDSEDETKDLTDLEDEIKDEEEEIL